MFSNKVGGGSGSSGKGSLHGLVQDYLGLKEGSPKKEQLFTEITKKIDHCLAGYLSEKAKGTGEAILPAVFNPATLRLVFSSNDLKLKKLFFPAVPEPRPESYASGDGGEEVDMKRNAVTAAIKKFSSMWKSRSPETKPVALQRRLRDRRRHRENIRRLTGYNQEFWRAMWLPGALAKPAVEEAVLGEADSENKNAEPEGVNTQTIDDLCGAEVPQELRRMLNEIYDRDSIETVLALPYTELVKPGAVELFYKRHRKIQLHALFNPEAMKGLKVKTEELLRDANTPYQPVGCAPDLSNTLVAAAKKCQLFKEVKHITSHDALVSICNDGLMGQRTLRDLGLSFVPAALGGYDIMNGDANAICCSSSNIDPSAKSGRKHPTTICMDSSKVRPDFFKQKDLGFKFPPNRGVYSRPITIGALSFGFSHTHNKPSGSATEVNFYTSSGADQREDELCVNIPEVFLISDNAEDMHAILILNFFRLIDSMYLSGKTKQVEFAKKVYSELSGLSPAELEKTLTDIGQNFSDTMEFNFYGVRQLDFDAITRIVKENTPTEGAKYELVFSDFTKQLTEGEATALDAAKESIPELFQSHRFVDWLISRVEPNKGNEVVLDTLKGLKGKCDLPYWFEVERQQQGEGGAPKP
jgi:hypothetical protein